MAVESTIDLDAAEPFHYLNLVISLTICEALMAITTLFMADIVG